MECHDNHVVILGNIVSKQNTLKYFANGTAMISLQILTKRKWRDSSGQWQEVANYFDVTVFGHQAEQIANHAVAGHAIYVRGNIRSKVNSKGNISSFIEAQSIRFINKSSAINWNQVHLSASLINHSELVQTINGTDLLTLSVNVSESIDKEQIIEVKLKGAAAKLVSSQLNDDVSNLIVLVEGSLSSQSKKIGDEFSHHYWVDGHTCVLSPA